MTLEIEMQRKIKQQGKSTKTFETYWTWCLKYIRYLKDKNKGQWMHPKDCGRQEIESWLSYLANDEHVAKNTQNVAFQSVLYLYKHVLGIEIQNVHALRSKRTRVVHDVLSVQEVASLFTHLDGVALLAAKLMYGGGLRIGDMIALRLKDISFEREQICVKTAKGDKWRYVQFPKCVHHLVKRQIESVKVIHKYDERDNPNGVSLPDSYRKKSPSAARSLAWYWLFPGDNLSKGHEGILCRHHRHQDHVARKIKEAAERAQIIKRVTSHILRHSYATHLHESGTSIRSLMDLLGHESMETTAIYLHSSKLGATSVQSPLESLPVKPSPMITALSNPKPSVSVSTTRLRVVG
jgi:integron integrase